MFQLAVSEYWTLWVTTLVVSVLDSREDLINIQETYPLLGGMVVGHLTSSVPTVNFTLTYCRSSPLVFVLRSVRTDVCSGFGIVLP